MRWWRRWRWVVLWALLLVVIFGAAAVGVYAAYRGGG